mgnify:CR=1 FL=1
MYQELKGNENFSDKYATWIIAYCLDTDSFLQRIKDISFGNIMMNSNAKMMLCIISEIIWKSLEMLGKKY